MKIMMFPDYTDDSSSKRDSLAYYFQISQRRPDYVESKESSFILPNTLAETDPPQSPRGLI